MKNTKQRNVILDIVNNNYEHLDAYGIYKKAREKIPNISLGTIYRNLNVMVENGDIKKLVIDHENDRYDRIDNHIHFICDACNELYDVYGYETKNIKNIDGHKVMNCEILLKGICKKCQEKE